MNKLLFVYNAQSGIFHAFGDMVHKIVEPDSYACQLCALTYGSVSMKNQWKQFVKKLDLDVIFLHKDEFMKRYPGQNDEFPAAFIEKEGVLSSFLTSEEINTSKNLDNLIDIVTKKLINTTN